MPNRDTVSKQRARLWLLLILHIGAGLFFSIWSAVEGTIAFVLEDLLVVPVLGIVLAQTSLLGFWGVFCPSSRWLRLLGLIAGIGYLEALLHLGAQEGVDPLATMAVCGTAAAFGLIRWFHTDLQRYPQEAIPAGGEGMTFSIRGLMLFTAVVAATIVGVREFRENVPSGANRLVIAIWSLCFVVTGLAGAWAGLGLARPMLRSAAVLLLAGVLGALLVYGVGPSEWDTYFYVISTMMFQAGVMIGSQLVVRSCGYRLVQRRSSNVSTAN